MLRKDKDLTNNHLYRITNEEEIHNGFQYKTGLNTDHIEFSPKGVCSSGGLYFFDLKEYCKYK